MEIQNKTEEELKQMFCPGKVFYRGPRDKYHVVNYTYDGDIELIIIKSWNKWKKYWCYETYEWDTFYKIDIRFNYVRLSKPKMKK